MSKYDNNDNVVLGDLWKMFPKKSLANVAQKVYDPRFTNTLEVIRQTTLKSMDGKAFGDSDSVTAIVLRLDRQPIGTTAPRDDGYVAKCMVLDNYHTALLPIPDSVSEVDRASQIKIDAFPEFKFTREINSQVQVGAIVGVTFDAGSLTTGRITDVSNTKLQNIVESRLAKDLQKETPSLFRDAQMLEEFPGLMTEEDDPKFKRVFIDYGHGGFINDQYTTRRDKGKRYTFTDWSSLGAHPMSNFLDTRNGADNNTLYEGEFNREVAWRLINMLVNLGIETYDAVARRQVTSTLGYDDLEQADIGLGPRTRWVNAQDTEDAVLFSLHANAQGNPNAGPSRGARGVGVHTMPEEDASDIVAETLYEAFLATPVGMHLRDASRRREYNYGEYPHDFEADYMILRESNCPAVIGEVGFFTNYHDAVLMTQPHIQAQVALAYFKALIQHMDPDSVPASTSDEEAGV